VVLHVVAAVQLVAAVLLQIAAELAAAGFRTR
jgi:hypothetical protein